MGPAKVKWLTADTLWVTATKRACGMYYSEWSRIFRHCWCLQISSALQCLSLRQLSYHVHFFTITSFCGPHCVLKHWLSIGSPLPLSRLLTNLHERCWRCSVYSLQTSMYVSLLPTLCYHYVQYLDLPLLSLNYVPSEIIIAFSFNYNNCLCKITSKYHV